MRNSEIRNRERRILMTDCQGNKTRGKYPKPPKATENKLVNIKS